MKQHFKDQPEFPEFRFGLYYNKRRGVFYLAVGWGWNSNNDRSGWNVVHYNVADTERKFPFFRHPDEFMDKFEWAELRE